MIQQPEISIVIPVYKAENIINKLVFELQNSLRKINLSHEIILVDDRSPDNSWEVMKVLSYKHSELKIIRLSRNFGQHPAILAGLSFATGEWIVVMDCDLQDNPIEIPKLYNKANEGFDIVLARRKIRNDNFLKKLSSSIFSKVFSFFTDSKYDNEIANFGIYNKRVIKEVLKIDDYIKFFPLFVNWVGFKSTSVIVEHNERFEGNSSYNLSKLINLAFNIIISYSNKPLKLFVKFGLIISVISFFIGTYYLYNAITNKISVLGYASLIISIWFLFGILITTIGITGIYVGKIFDQTKNRPYFIIDELL